MKVVGWVGCTAWGLGLVWYHRWGQVEVGRVAHPYVGEGGWRLWWVHCVAYQDRAPPICPQLPPDPPPDFFTSCHPQGTPRVPPSGERFWGGRRRGVVGAGVACHL